MIIIWGSKHRKNDLGVVAEWCDSCQSVQPAIVTEHYQVGHIYYIPLGKGTLKATSRQCMRCGGEFMAERSAYSAFLPAAQVRAVNTDDLMVRTNPGLADTIIERRQLEADLADQSTELSIDDEAPGATSGRPDPRVQEALSKLNQFDARDEDVRRFMGQLRSFASLDANGQAVLINEIDAYCDGNTKARQTVAFTRTLKSPPFGTGGCLLGLVVMVGAAAGIFALPFLQDWVWGSIVGVVAAGFGFVIYAILQGRATRAWVEKHVVPRMLEDQIDPQFFVGLLANIDTKDEEIDEKLREIAGEAEQIAEVLLEQGHLKDESPADPT